MKPKKLLITSLFFFSALIGTLFFATYTDALLIRSALELITPDGGEVVVAGSPYTIEWDESGTFDAISLHYKRRVRDDQGPEVLIAQQPPFYTGSNRKTFTWFVPASLGDTYESFKMIVRAWDEGKIKEEEESEGFFVVIPAGQSPPSTLAHALSNDNLSIDLTGPHPGRVFKKGDNLFISWQQENLNTIDIGLTADNGKTVDWIIRDHQVHPDRKVGSVVYSIPLNQDFRDVYYKIYLKGERTTVGQVIDQNADFFTITMDGDTKIGIENVSVPINVVQGHTAEFSWNHYNINAVRVSYTAEPYTVASRFTTLAAALTVDTTVLSGSNQGDYSWSVLPGFPSGYYAIKIEGFIGGNKVSEAVSEDYFFVGDTAESGYRGVIQTEKPFFLDIQGMAQVLTTDSATITWDLRGESISGSVDLEYGTTPHYGQKITFSSDTGTSEVEQLNDLLTGQVYHYRFVQGSLVSPDFTFSIPGAIDRLGYTVLHQTNAAMRIRLEWESDSSEFVIYSCTLPCPRTDAWVFQGTTTEKDFEVSPVVRIGQSVQYRVTPHVADALAQGLGAQVTIPHSGQFVPPVILPEYAGPVAVNRGYEDVRGKILLRVQKRGEAFYVSPHDGTMQFLGEPGRALMFLRGQGVGITTKNLMKIPIGLNSDSGVDTDGDGLSDRFEQALGTDSNDKDTDQDGYTDKLEVDNNYSPLNPLPERVAIDRQFAKKQLGRVFLAVEDRGQAWYVSPQDSRRYFLGRSQDAFQIMRLFGQGITEQGFVELQ